MKGEKHECRGKAVQNMLHNSLDLEIIRVLLLVPSLLLSLSHLPPPPPPPPPPLSLSLSLFQICSIVVFGCISDKVQVSGGCGYNYSNACSFGVAVGVIAFLLCLAFLVRDVIYVVIDFRNNVMVPKSFI